MIESFYEEKYSINCKYGRLKVWAFGCEFDFWLHNQRGDFNLFQEKENSQSQLELPFDHSLETKALEDLLLKIGDRALHVASQFAVGRSRILEFCINGPEEKALELVEDCPFLAYLIAYKLLPHTAQETLTETIHGILTKKRKAILHQMNWPSEKGVVNLLRKIPASQSGEDTAQAIHSILTSGNLAKVKILRHLPTLHRDVVNLLADEEFSPYFTPSFYMELSQIQPDKIPPLWNEIFDIKKQILEAISDGFRLSPLKSWGDLYALHEKFIWRLREIKHYEKIEHFVFPPPPFPKKVLKKEGPREFGIFPIKTAFLLWLEGVDMHNCIVRYVRDIANTERLRYAYHVQLPDEAPASLMIRAYGNKWYVEELKGKYNQEVSASLSHWVKIWLCMARASRPETESL